MIELIFQPWKFAYMAHIHKKIKQLSERSRNDIISSSDEKSRKRPLFYSFEFFPPKTEQGMNNLLHRIDRMVARFSPLFIDVTWGSHGSTFNRSLQVASHAQRFSGVDVLLHLTLSGMTTETLKMALDQAKGCGVRNILALRGEDKRKCSFSEIDDPNLKTKNSEDMPLIYAADLVKFIRDNYGDYFSVGVAGHPERHERSSLSLDDELFYLKEKVDTGADFIVTQLFYDADAFIHYVQKCRSIGILCPILPGVMPIQSFSSFQRMTDYCGIHVPIEIWNKLNPIRDNDEYVKDLGCKLAIDLCEKLLDAGVGDGVHLYTLNLERSVSNILSYFEDKCSEENKTVQSSRILPWRQSAMEKRSKQEGIRPIHWANRPKSYVLRTECWDEYPNGRWGPSSSPAFGELSDSHFYSYTMGSDDDRIAMLGETPRTLQDIYETFAKYIEGTITHLPWCETPLQPESFLLQDQLASLNRHGFLTLNSQPAVNGVKSEDNIFGWGRRNGYVYQKAYAEAFVSPENIEKLMSVVSSDPNLNLYAINSEGEEYRIGMEEDGVTALTWGVFPNREVLQPTIFDPKVFSIWSEEAFLLWKTMWQNLYEIGNDSWELIETIHKTFFLVAIIDHNYIGSNDCLWSALHSIFNNDKD